MTEKEKQIALWWIETQLTPIRTCNNRHSSYGLKHMLEYDTDVYTTNDEFKQLMEDCGYHPTYPWGDKHFPNPSYNISEKSPACRRHRGVYTPHLIPLPPHLT